MPEAVALADGCVGTRNVGRTPVTAAMPVQMRRVIRKPWWLRSARNRNGQVEATIFLHESVIPRAMARLEVVYHSPRERVVGL